MKLGLKILMLLVFASGIYALEPVNMDQSIDIALENAPSIKIYKENLSQAKSTIDLANSYYNPTLTGAVAYTQRGPKVETGGVVTSPSRLSDAQVTLTYPIDLGDTMGVYVKGSKSIYKSTEIGLTTTVLDLIKNVKTSYLQCLLYQENVDTAKSAEKLSQDYLTKINQEVEAGVKARFDITRQEYDLSTRKNATISAEGNYSQIVNTFNYIIGKETDFVVPTPLEDLNVANVNMDDNLLETAFANRPELKKAYQDLETANLNVLAKKKVNNPTLALVGNVDQLLVNQTSAKDTTWSATANLSIPIFDGGIAARNTDIAQSQADQQKEQIEAIKQSIITGVLNAKLACETAKAQILTCESAVKLAKEAYEIAQVRYEENLGTYLDVSDSLDQLVAAQNSLSVAKYSYAISLVALEREIATTLKTEDYTGVIIEEVNKKPVKIKKSGEAK